MRLAGKLEKQSIWVVRFIYVLSFFLVINILVELINLPLPLRRIYELAGCCIWLAYFGWRLLQIRHSSQPYLRVAILLICLSFMVIIVATIMGYDKLSQYLFKGMFLTIFLYISSIILFNTTRILLELLLTMIPVIRRHAGVIITSLQPFIFCLCAILFYASFSSVWLLFPTAQDAIKALAAFGIPFGSYTLTMETVVVGLGIIYGALLISRAIQAILLDEIMPRNNIDLGVQLSITRLVHYTILLIGFLVLLQVMGVSLTKLTILGGALGVGIGFGLQTIVNNFASGLILLFERPLKVGDTIELGTEMGVVKHLGLRSTIIKTFDNAEIVVPNSDLVSAQVTNWTLAERKARVKVPIGVAYGSDINQVLQILLSVAGDHPMTLTTPPPRALFLNFGASSLDFELRVWIADFSDRRQVQSELNQEINNEFADAGIEIPFPQTDLHIRTIDREAAETLRPDTAATAPKHADPSSQECGNSAPAV
jgi:small-conductance mechanosensitive channel